MSRRTIVALVSLALVGACADGTDPVGTPDAAFALGNAPAELPVPVFDLATNPDGSLLAGQVFAGVTELRKGRATMLAELPGVTGLAPIGRGNLLAITGGGFGPPELSRKLYRISQGNSRMIADLGAYEEAVNPDQVWNIGEPDSNPYNIVGLGGGAALVSDAAANDILHVSSNGTIDWVAVLTPQVASTAFIKDLVGCPSGPPDICGLPPARVAQPVATSIAVGPDGAYYAGELTGFPGTPGMSRVWRIAAGSRHVLCPSASCTEAISGLTSIVDLEFGPDGLLYVVELDAASWLAIEIFGASVGGGNVKACDVVAGTCDTVASGLSLPLAITFDANGTPWIAENSGIPGTASIHPLF